VILISNDELKTDLMDKYEKETGKKAIWHGRITQSFKKWKKGEKIYIDDKERIAILVTDSIKTNWQEFAKKNNIQTISKLIRDSVEFYMNIKTKLIDFENISKITHYLKEPLTSIKGFSEILIEEYKQELSWDVLLKIRNIFDQSLILEERIQNLSLNKNEEENQCDVLIVDDDLLTIKLLRDYFERKGYKCKEAHDGKGTLKFLETNIPKLILLDIILPDISGYDICNTIKSENKLKNIKIYYITAVPPIEVKKKVKETGAEGFFLKPFKIGEFSKLFEYL